MGQIRELGPVEVEGDAEEAHGQPESIRSHCVVQAQSIDLSPVQPGNTRVARERLEGLVVVGGAAYVEKHGTPNAPEEADRREQNIDQREAKLRVGVEAAMADEGVERIPAHFAVASEPEEIGILAGTAEPAQAHRKQAGARELEVLAGVDLKRLP